MSIPTITISKKPTYLTLASDVNFFELFQKIRAHYKTCFLAESLGEHHDSSRYALIGFNPAHVICAKEKTIYFDDAAYEVDNPYRALQKMIPQDCIARRYAGGLFGYMSYEAVNYFEPSLSVKTHPQFDQFMFGVYTDGIILDTMTQQLFYFYYDVNRFEEVRAILSNHSPVIPSTGSGQALSAAKDPLTSGERDSSVAEPALSEANVTLSQNDSEEKFTVRDIGDTLTPAAHRAIVEHTKEHIRAGNTFQCEVGFKSEYEISGSPISVYAKLREVNPSPFMFYLQHKDETILGASPELILQVQNREVKTVPLAGTIKRGATPEEDVAFARQLLNDPKETAEHVMLVDMARNDVGRVSSVGTVKVESLMDINKYSHVQHIASTVTGILKPGEDMFSALASIMPSGVLSGSPKIESIKIINENEPTARGPYGGAVGSFGFNGDCTFAIPIRSLFCKGSYAYTQTSSGIVYDSDAEKEYQEIQHKLAAMKKVLGSFCHPERGVAADEGSLPNSLTI